MKTEFIGKEFATLRVVSYSHRKNKTTYWNCHCNNCGRDVVVAKSNLKSPRLRSCGCLRNRHGKDHKSWRGCGDLPAAHVCHIRSQASRRGIHFDVSVEYLWSIYQKQEGRCALSGLLINLSPSFCKRGKNHTASLDRIDSSKGYIEGNVQWLHKDVNFMKQQFSQEYFVYLCEKVTENKEKL